MGVKNKNDGNQAVVLWGLIIIVFMAFLLWMVFVARAHPFTQAVIIGVVMTIGPDTEERLKAISAQAAAKAVHEELEQFYNEKMLPVLVRKEKRAGVLIKIWIAGKDAILLFAKAIEKIRIE